MTTVPWGVCVRGVCVRARVCAGWKLPHQALYVLLPTTSRSSRAHPAAHCTSAEWTLGEMVVAAASGQRLKAQQPEVCVLMHLSSHGTWPGEIWEAGSGGAHSGADTSTLHTYGRGAGILPAS